jgi:hypothetical protein
MNNDLPGRLRRHIEQMAPHQRDREQGRLLAESLAELERTKISLRDPAFVHAMMLRGEIAQIGWRNTCHLTGEVLNGEDMQLAEIVRLREELERLRADAAQVREVVVNAIQGVGYIEMDGQLLRYMGANVFVELEETLNQRPNTVLSGPARKE